jgi:hypothetical protein
MRTGWIRLDLSAEIADVDPQDVHLAFIGCTPHLSEQVMMGDYPACVLHQQPQNIVFGGGE